jgi:putative RecB family exonuclease
VTVISDRLFDADDGLFELNPSKLQCYIDCPRQYRFRYVDKRTERRQFGPTALGRVVHKALRDFYGMPSEDRTVENLLRALRLAWDGTGYRSAKEAEDAFSRAEDMLRRYHEGNDPQKARVVALESKFSHARSSDGILITGRVDRIDMDGDDYVIVDYKTGRFGSDDIALNESLPLSLYALAVSAVLGRDVNRIAIEHLSSGRRAETRRRPDRLAQDWPKITGLATEMRSGADYPAKPTARCRWCDYLVACPEGRAAIRVPNAPEDDVPPLLDADEPG